MAVNSLGKTRLQMKCLVEKKTILGIELDEWTYKSCFADIATGDDWATIYFMMSDEPSKGHASVILQEAKEFYEALGKRFGSTVALSAPMKHLLVKFNIHEYD